MNAQAVQNAGGAKKADSAKGKPAPVGKAPKATTAPAAQGPAKRPRPFDFAALMAGMATKVDIKEVNGQHNLYFVFKNDKAGPEEPLMSLSNIQFKEEKAQDKPKP